MSKGRGWAWVTRDGHSDLYVKVWLGGQTKPKRSYHERLGCDVWKADSWSEEFCYEDWRKVTGITIPSLGIVKVRFTEEEV